MATPSPSEFLTFYRRVAMHPSLRQGLVARQQSIRPFSLSTPRFGYGRSDEANPDEKHTTNKTDKTDVQNESSARGHEAHATGTGGSATSRKDDQNSTARAKKEHPEAPDVVIGMQDERGGKGA